MKLNLKWLWITWVIQNHTANQEAFITGLKEGRSDVYKLPKEIKQKTVDNGINVCYYKFIR